MALNSSTLNALSGLAQGFASREARQSKSKAYHTEKASLGYCSDAVLIRACLDGSQTAWNELIDRYQRLVYSIPRRYNLALDDCDDVFQNVFTIVFRSLASLRDQTRLSAWLITIAHRECQRVRKQTPLHVELDENILDPITPVADQVQHWERQHLLRQAIDQLDTRSQKLLQALFFDTSNPSYQEIAERLGMPVGSVAPTRARCFKKLETILNAMDAGIFNPA